MLKLKALCLLGLLFAGKLLAGDETRSSRLYAGQLAPGLFIVSHDDKFVAGIGTPPNATNYANRAVVELGLDEDRHVVLAAQTICVKFDVAVTDVNSNTMVYTNQQLTINYNPQQQTRYKDKAQLVFPNTYKVKVYNITFNTCVLGTGCGPACNTPYTGNDAYIQAEVSTNRIYNFGFTSSLAVTDVGQQVVTAGKELPITWNYVIGAEEYEMEYTYVDDYSSTIGAYTPASSLTYDLEHDATRITTTQNSYNIPLTYEHGYIIFRVRPIGRSPLNERTEGAWTGAQPNGIITNAPNIGFYTLIGTLSNDALNWQSLKTFAENGKTGTGISYSDALGYKRQSLARLNTDEKTIAQSTLYDFYGRPAVSLLPSPVAGLNFDYRFNLNKYTGVSGAVEFEKNIFDKVLVANPCAANGFALNTSSSAGAANYYSPANSNQSGFQGYVPDANGLPYTQSLFKPDGLGRVLSQSLPGATHQLGSGREMKYFYAQPAQVELDRLFGAEAPAAAKCYKNYALDPNGQLSTTYIDQDGRTIATALVGNPPFNVDALPNLPTSLALTDVLQLEPTNHRDTANKCIEVNTTFFVADANSQQGMVYQTTLAQFGSNCTPNLCFNCVYDLQISLTDDCGNNIAPVFFNNTVPAGPYAATACSAGTYTQILGSALNAPVTVLFPGVGTYVLNKKICVSDAPLEDYVQAFKDNQVCTDPCHYVDSLVAATDFSGCGPQGCAACMASISNYTSGANSDKGKYDSDGNPLNPSYTGTIDPVPTQQQLSKWLEGCDDLCGPTTECDKYTRMLLADFFPNNGQLAQGSSDSRWGNSIMNSATTLFGGSYWAAPPIAYLNAGGTADYVQQNGANVLPQNLSLNDYILNYRKSWAKAFLSKHPENCTLYFYCNVLGASLDYDEQLKNIVHYDTICANTGFIFPLGTLPGTIVAPPAAACAAPSADPIFSSLSGNALVTAMKNELLTNLYTNTNQNIYEYVAKQFYSTLPGGYNFGQEECSRDAMWDMFRSIYLSKKYALYQALYASYQSNPAAFGYSGTCPTLPAGYVSHFPDWGSVVDQSIPGSPSTMSQVNSMIATGNAAAGYNVGANIAAANSATAAANSASTCAGYVSLWNSNLNTACPAYANASASLKNDIMTAFQGVCAKGCDVNNPLGASTTPAGSGYVIMPANVTVYSFQDVLNYYLTNNACNASVISLPPPYPYTVSGGSPVQQGNLSSCHCDQILQVSASFQTMLAANTLPAGVTQEWQLFRKLYGYDLAEYYALKCVCNAAVASSPANSPWTPGLVWNNTQVSALASYPFPVNTKLSCTTCLKCSDVVTAINNLTLPSSNAYNNPIDKIKNDSINTYYALALLNNQFGVHDLKFYFDLYNDCSSFNSSGATAFTFSNTISDEALDLYNYLGQLIQKKNLLKNNRSLSLCQDDKYYLTTLYNGNLPTLNALTYNYTISGSTLNFTIKDAVPNTLLAVSLTLPGSYAGTWTDLLYLNNFVAYNPTPVSGPNYGFKVDATDVNFLTGITITGQVTNLAFPISQLSSGANPVPVVCQKTAKPKNTCAITLLNNALVQGRMLFDQQNDNLVANFVGAYREYCFNSLSETFFRNYNFAKEYNYTLYYYDEAGNLQRTVAPNGVAPIPGLTSNLPVNSTQVPLHSSGTNGVSQMYVSDYRFNASNQPVKEITVDGGATNYLYDNVGRIIASQNAKQAAASSNTMHVYSYTLYDAIGRTIEVGEMSSTTDLFATANVNVKSYSAFAAVVAAATRKQVNNTYYDDLANMPLSGNAGAYFALPNHAPAYLRNRVAGTAYSENPVNGYDHATYYSYDDHGNVAFVVQENNLLGNSLAGPVTSYNMQFKRLDYEYDLISGNMLKVVYQNGQPDQFMHKYYYDADNRLHEVYTSKDSLNWDRDAKYFYYEHGPLARVERADKQVQGQDFYYTIQGWLKGVNSDAMQPNNDAGKDAALTNAYLSNYNKIHGYFAKDAMSFALNYFNNATPTTANMDYSAINAGSYNNANSLPPAASLVNLYSSNPALYLDNGLGLGDGPSLYNGNISSMVTGFIDKDASNTITDNLPFMQLTAYRYDQLHRIKAMKAHRSFSGNAWNAAASGSTYDDSYRMGFSYDGNGNLLTLFRYGAAPTLKTGSALAMDDLTYGYKTLANSAAVNSNQLYGVFDAASSSAYTDDIKASTTFAAYNGTSDRYNYDEIGSLVKDAGEYIASIEWTVDRKVRRITRDAAAMAAAPGSVTKPDIEYEYNAQRQRVTKIVKPRDPSTKALTQDINWQYTYYVYDASGNVIAVYDRSAFSNGVDYTDAVKLSESHIYGSKRLAIARPVDPSYAQWSYRFSPCGTPGGVNNCRTFSAGSITNPVVPPPTPSFSASRNLGYKEFELDNHLGNVIATVSDRKVVVTGCPNEFLHNFNPPGGGTAPFDPINSNLGTATGALRVTPTGTNAGVSFTYTADQNDQLSINFDFDPGNSSTADNITAAVYPYNSSTNTYGPAFASMALNSSGSYSLPFTGPVAGSGYNSMYMEFRTQSGTVTPHYFDLDNFSVARIVPGGLSSSPPCTSGLFMGYFPDLLMHTDYYAFGQEMPGRNWVASNYRYGMNGQERQDELFRGADAAQYWMYDARIGRRWNLDPIVKTWESSYAAFDNNPVYFADPSGLDGEKGGGNGGGKGNKSQPNKKSTENANQMTKISSDNIKQKLQTGQAARTSPNISAEKSSMGEMPEGEPQLKAVMTNGPDKGQPLPAEPITNLTKTAENYTIMDLTPYKPTISWYTDGKWSWYKETKDPWRGREYLRYARWEGEWSPDGSVEAGPFSVNKDGNLQLGAGPASISKNSGELVVVGWDKSVEKFANIFKPDKPLLSSSTATAVYEFIYDQNRVLLSGKINLKVQRSFIFTPGGKSIGPSETLVDTIYDSGLATPGIPGPVSFQRK